MGDTLAKNGFAMPEPFLGAHEFCCKMLQITSTKVFEFASFEQIPDPFVRIEFGRIARQAFQMETFSSTLRKEILDDLAAMDRGPIPNDEQLPSDLAQQELQEPDDRGSAERARSAFAHAARRCARPGAAGKRLPHRSTPGFALPPGLFFNASQRSSFQALIAASSRWLARCTGCCWLQPASRASRPA